MTKVIMEIFRYEKDGITCSRCCDTTEVAKKVLNDFKLSNPNIDVELKDIPLGEDMVDVSNTVKINGKDVRDILGIDKKVLTACPSCSELMGKKTDCISHVYRGKIYDSLTEEMLKEALYDEAMKNTF